MTSHILQIVWPILDDAYTRKELIEDAKEQLDGMADQAHAVITGPPLWLIVPAEQVPGWQAYAPGSVLIAHTPAEPAGAWRRWNSLTDIDGEVVDRAVLDGTAPRRLGRAELEEAVTRMAGQYLDAEMARRTGRSQAGVMRCRNRLGVAPTQPSGRRELTAA